MEINQKRKSFLALALFFGFLFLIVYIYSINNSVKVISGKDTLVLSAEELSKMSSQVTVGESKINYSEPYEVLSKRTYNSKTFKNPDGTYTSEISNGDIFFFDGEEYVKLEKLSEPTLEKKDIILNEIPKSNVVDFGDYILYEGVNVSLGNYELVLKDGNDKIVKSLARPFSTDANGSVSLGEFDFELKGRNLNLDVVVDEDWLANAEYPVVVDPTYSFDNDSGVYDGYVVSGITRVIIQINVGRRKFLDGTLLLRGFIEFNTSAISNDVSVTNVILNITSIGSFTDIHNNVSISRFNNSHISNPTNYSDNSSGNQALFNNISSGYNSLGYYLINLTNFYNNNTNHAFDLGANADMDLKSQLPNDFFGVGLVSTEKVIAVDDGDEVSINSSDAGGTSSGPKLLVSYTGGACNPENLGGFICNTTCSYNSGTYQIWGNITVQDSCVLTLSGTANFDFDNPNLNIYVYPGGEIRISGSAGINK